MTPHAAGGLRTRVLLVRMDGIGDALATLPLALALRAADCTVGAVLSPRNAELFVPGFFARTHVLVPDAHRRHGSTADSFARARAEIEGAYDVALVCSEEPDAYRLPALAGVALRVGFWHAFEKPFKSLWQRWRCTRVVYRPAAWIEQPHEVAQIFALGEAAGLVTGAPPRNAAAGRAALGVEGVRSGEILAVQATRKLVPAGRDARWVGGALRALPGGTRLFAQQAERELAEALGRASGHAYDLFASTGEWVRAIAGAGRLVTPDSGAAHVAGMVGTPVVDVFPRTHGERLARQWHPWAAPYAVTLEPEEREGEQSYGARLAEAAESLLLRA